MCKYITQGKADGNSCGAFTLAYYEWEISGHAKAEAADRAYISALYNDIVFGCAMPGFESYSNPMLMMRRLAKRGAKPVFHLGENPLIRQMFGVLSAAAKQEVASVEKSIRDVEAAVETKRDYIGKMKTLQSNTRKNEEYQMCIQEVEKTEAAIDALETSELELMERLETAKTDMEQKIRRARDAQREMEETLARFDRTAETDKELLDHLNAERADLAAAVPEDSLGEYERMTKSKGVPVIVPMDEKGHCGGCHMVITDNARMKVLGGHETVYCDSCHRILH